MKATILCMQLTSSWASLNPLIKLLLLAMFWVRSSYNCLNFSLTESVCLMVLLAGRVHFNTLSSYIISYDSYDMAHINEKPFCRSDNNIECQNRFKILK